MHTEPKTLLAEYFDNHRNNKELPTPEQTYCYVDPLEQILFGYMNICIKNGHVLPSAISFGDNALDNRGRVSQMCW